MKKTLHALRFISILLCLALALPISGQTKKRLYPTASMAGITNNNGTFKKQSISSEPKTIALGNDNGVIGRGYLEFDMSSIPSNATINSVGLQLTSAITYSSDFNGYIHILQGVDGLSVADFVTWSQMERIGPNMGSITFQYEGDGWDFQSAHLLALTKERVKNSQKMYIQLNHNDESKLVKLSGGTNDLFLEVNYTTQSSGGGDIRTYKLWSRNIVYRRDGRLYCTMYVVSAIFKRTF